MNLKSKILVMEPHFWQGRGKKIYSTKNKKQKLSYKRQQFNQKMVRVFANIQKKKVQDFYQK